MRDGGKVSEISIREALPKSLFLAAMNGNARSQGVAFDWFQAAEIQYARDRVERQQFARTWQQLQQAELETAATEGADTRLVLPHPDDIVIDDDFGYHLVGPFD
ncbi:MAG: hypothetical protein KF849_10240 [Rhizobiaceae bacterium]|nr:hypothetical protein [Rhizobiaceae bacterium]